MSKRVYNKWSEENMRNAIEAFRKKECGLNECSRRFGIPKPTLKRYLKSSEAEPLDLKKKMGALQTLPKNVEDDLVEHILKLQASLVSLDITDIRRLAFQAAEKHQLSHRFNSVTKTAGKKWFYSFIKRHPEILLQHGNKKRSEEGGKDLVNSVFDMLEENSKANGMTANDVYNVDEFGLSTQLSCEQREISASVVCCCNAAGSFVPPMFVFKNENVEIDLEREAPPDSLIEIAEYGFITSDLFPKWLKHFIRIVRPSLERKVLLLFDGNATNTKNIETLDLAQKNGVILLQLPKDKSKRLQPLHVGVFGGLQIYFEEALGQWINENPHQRVSQSNVMPLITMAYYRAATVGNAVSGFEESGCWPINRLIVNSFDFSDIEFPALEFQMTDGSDNFASELSDTPGCSTDS